MKTKIIPIEYYIDNMKFQTNIEGKFEQGNDQVLF